MAKVSPVSIKYMIKANLIADGALEKPDVIGALFGQTEGLLGSDLEMRDLQKEGKIGRIEVDLEKKERKTYGKVKIPTALDQSETTLIAAAIETIERVGPSDAQIEIEKIEDVRGSKRDYILDRAKKLMSQIQGSSDSREISNQIKDSTRMSEITEYGKNKLACGDITGDELIVVEGRADVVNLIKSGIKNVIGMNGTKLPEEIKELGKEKEITLFVDGDRGGKLIAKNVSENANIKYIAIAPDGKEVEELSPKEVLMNLRRKVSVEDFFRRHSENRRSSSNFILNQEKKDRLKDIYSQNEGKKKAVFLDENLEETKESSLKEIPNTLKKIRKNIPVILIDGSATKPIINACEKNNVKVLVAKNFTTTETNIKLLSF